MSTSSKRPSLLAAGPGLRQNTSHRSHHGHPARRYTQKPLPAITPAALLHLQPFLHVPHRRLFIPVRLRPRHLIRIPLHLLTVLLTTIIPPARTRRPPFLLPLLLLHHT